MNTSRLIIIKSTVKFIKDTVTMRYSTINPIITYQGAIEALNGLQSNAAYLRTAPKHDATVNKNLDDTKKYLSRCGISLEQLDRLSIIHVAGTKGKGSTCAYIDAILRNCGYKTGLYTSPHLVSVRERIMLNSVPISEEMFINHFHIVYEKLMQQRTHDNDMPAYFKFLTLLMFHIFLNSSIDVAIIEVGIGGEYDCTNIIRNPVCVGITKLDLDHTALLGDNIQAIAYQKSGIFKRNVPAFTVPQLSQAISTLFDRAIEKNCQLNIVPPISSYKFKKNPPTLGIPANIQYDNASLAIQLSNEWLISKINNNINNESEIETGSDKNLQIDMNKVELALEKCKWPGRTQILRGSCIDFYLDGAHTVASIRGCIEWFKSVTNNKYNKRKRVLMFNVMGNRDVIGFLNVLKPLNFDSAFFVPNVSGISDNFDQNNKSTTIDKQISLCEINSRYWGENGFYAKSVNDAFDLIKDKYQLNDFCVDDNDYKIDLLITGSLHLVGAALSVLDPNLTMKTNF